MIDFNLNTYAALDTDEAKVAYLTECFGDDQAAKDAAIEVAVAA